MPHYGNNILPFCVVRVGLLMLPYTQGMNANCILPQVGYCFYCEVREDVVSSVPEDILWYWLRSHLGLPAQGRCVLYFNVFCMHLLNVGFHCMFC